VSYRSIKLTLISTIPLGGSRICYHKFEALAVIIQFVTRSIHTSLTNVLSHLSTFSALFSIRYLQVRLAMIVIHWSPPR
jgi:hypothetical protein